MSLSAIILMCVSMLTIWGGLAFSIMNYVKKSKELGYEEFESEASELEIS